MNQSYKDIIYKIVIGVVAVFSIYSIVYVVLVYSLKIPEFVRITPDQAIEKELKGGKEVWVDQSRSYQMIYSHNLVLEQGIPIFATSDTFPDAIWIPVYCSVGTLCPQYTGLDLLPEEQISYGDGYEDEFMGHLLNELKAKENGYKIYHFSGVWFSVPPNPTSISGVTAFGLTGIKPVGPQFSSISYSEFQNILKDYRFAFDKNRHSFSYREQILKKKIQAVFE